MTAQGPEPLPGLPGLMGITLLTAGPDQVEAALTIGPQHLAATGYLHAGCVVTLADTVCGYGCLAALPDGKAGFTTMQLASNHLATAKIGQHLRAAARAVHRGRTTQVWDAIVTVDTETGSEGAPSGRSIVVFRCTQLLLDGHR